MKYLYIILLIYSGACWGVAFVMYGMIPGRKDKTDIIALILAPLLFPIELISSIIGNFKNK